METERWSGAGVPRGTDYDRRFEALADAGRDVHGEARFVASFEPRRVLDAGCGTGRVAVELARRGIEVVGVDRDAAMLDAARIKAPLVWVEADLSTLDLGRRFDLVVMAGNVVLFVDAGTESAVVERMAAHLDPGGRLVSGFELRGRGPGPRGSALLEAYDRWCSAVGFRLEHRFATWDKGPYVAGGGYAVSVHRLAG